MKKKLKSKKIVKKINKKKSLKKINKINVAAKEIKENYDEKIKQKTIGHNPLIDYLESKVEIPQKNDQERVDNNQEITPAISKIAKQRITLHISQDIIERFKNTVFWQPGLTLASFAEYALNEALTKVEKERGAPFPQRVNPLKSGRPIK